MSRPNFEETIIIPPLLTDWQALPLITDTQYLEPLASNSLNRKFYGIVRAGVFRGFECAPAGGMKLRVSSGEQFGVALVERDDYILTVRQQHDIDVEIPAGATSYVVLEAFYKHGVKTKQVDLSSDVEASEIKVLPQSAVEPHHLILCRATVPTGASELTLIHLNFDDREQGGYDLQGHVSHPDPHKQYAMRDEAKAHYADHNNPHGVTKEQIGLGNVPNYPATSSVSDPSNEKFATAGAVKQAYDKGVEGLDRGNAAYTRAEQAETNANKHTDDRISTLLGGAPAEALDTIKELGDALMEQGDAAAAIAANIAQHKSDTSNPHKVTKAQVGLANVPNYAFTAAVNDASDVKFAAAGAVKKAYDLAASKMTQAQADERYLKLSGGTITDILSVGSSKFLMDGVNMMGAGTDVTRFGDGTYARPMNLNAKDGVVNVVGAAGSAAQRVFHEGYKPTANDVNAIPVDKLRGTPVAAYYLTGGSTNVGTKIRLPFKTNAAKMVTFSVRVYQGYKHYDIQFSGYLYATTNHWHAPQATMNGGTDTIAVKMGRDTDGTAYVWLAGGFYRGVAVLDVVGGHSTADWNTGWTITESDDTPNVAMATTLHPPVSSGGDTMTGTLQINGLHDNTTVAADAFKASGYGIMANRSVMYLHNANADGKVSIGVGGKYGENVKLSVNKDTVESAVPVFVKGADINVTPASSDAAIHLSTAANKNCSIRMREDSSKHGAYIQYRGANENDLVIGTYENTNPSQAISIPRGDSDVNFEKNIAVKGGLINLASKHRIVGETNGVKLQNVANGKNGWFGARNANWFHLETDAANGFHSYSHIEVPTIRVRGTATVLTLNATGSVSGEGITYNGKTAIGGSNDTWLRLNPHGQFTNGIYCGGTGVFRHDAQIQAGAWSSGNKASRAQAGHYDSSWGNNGIAAFSVNNPNSSGAHWAFASYYDANNIRSGMQILSNSGGNIRFYTNGRSKYAEIVDGNVYVSAPQSSAAHSLTRKDYVDSEISKTKLVLEHLFPVGHVIITFNTANPSTYGYPGTWVRMDNDTTLYSTTGTPSTTPKGSNTPNVPVAAHTHKYARVTKYRNQGNTNPGFHEIDMPTDNTWGLAVETGRSTPRTVAMSFMGNMENTASSGTSGATLDVRGKRYDVAMWRRTK
ncbi:hypothetical protein Q4902_004354 [Vibrio parahaemolyticus]|nr:hypothetical protein [Vibrio parahaemolyticus]